MTKEEIDKKAVEYTDTLNLQTDKDLTLVHWGFKHGALWMQESMIKEVEQFLRKHTRAYRFGRATICETDYCTNIDLIDAIKESLKGE